MKHLVTRICLSPILKGSKLILAYDFDCWQQNEDIKKISLYYNDPYGLELMGYAEEYQPKSKKALNFADIDFFPCILSVEDSDYEEWLSVTGFRPNKSAYENSNLFFLGYDVMDLCFTSIKSHGISAEYEKKYHLLNTFGLFSEYYDAKCYLDKNLSEIPEHSWKLVSIHTNYKSLNFIKKILKGDML